jgi:hypothetical protein
MLTQQTLDKMNQMKLSGMAEAFQQKDRNFNRAGGERRMKKSVVVGMEDGSPGRGKRGWPARRLCCDVVTGESKGVEAQEHWGIDGIGSSHAEGRVCGGGARSPWAVFLRCSRIFLMTRGSVV